MPKNPVFRDLKPVGGSKKHAFDISHRDIFSIKPAMLSVSFVADTIPDSEYQVRNANIVRVDAVQSTPFARMSMNTEYHFVPYSQLFRDFERLYYERGEQQRNALNQAGVSINKTTVPSFVYGDVVSAMFTSWVNLRTVLTCLNILEGINTEFQAVLYDPSLAPERKTLTKTYWINSAGVWIEQEFTFNYEQFNAFYSEFKTLRYKGGLAIHFPRDVFGRLCIEDMMRNFDMLGYGNVLPLFKSTFAGFFPKRLDGTGPYLQEDQYYENKLFEFFNTQRIISVTTVSVQSFVEGVSIDFDVQAERFNDNFPERVSVLRLAAYLKVWSDFYRNPQYDVDINYSYYFNYDYYTDSDTVPVDKVYQLLIPRYRQWKKDVFTGSYPTAQFGSVAVASLENPSTIVANLDEDLSSVTPVRSDTDGTLIVGNSVTDSFNINSSVSALSIRQAMSMQRYKERILRAGNRVHNLQRALFGDSSRYIEDEYSRFINAFSQTIDFNSVATTAEGNDRNVGELASNGVSTYMGDGFVYNSHDFGIIIGLTYILPEAEYEAYGLDSFNTKSISSDFYKEDFQNLGLAPVFNFNLNYLTKGNWLNPSMDIIAQNKGVFGYMARYWEYKLSYDKVHGEFFNAVPVSTSEFGDTLLGLAHARQLVGAFANYVTPRHINNNQLTLADLYVDPNCVDSIFYVNSDETQATDQFKVNMNHEITCILPMSVVGLPSL